MLHCATPLFLPFGLTFDYYMKLAFNFVPLFTGPDIWLEYAQYSIGGMGSPGGIDKVRSIFERAVTAVGLHMTKGQTLWEAYREFENAILSTVQVCISITRKLFIFPVIDLAATLIHSEEALCLSLCVCVRSFEM